jgi:hypothetical protein
MRVVFRHEARVEAREAKEWYQASVPGLGFEFVRALEVAFNPQYACPKHSRSSKASVAGCSCAVFRSPLSIAHVETNCLLSPCFTIVASQVPGLAVLVANDAFKPIAGGVFRINPPLWVGGGLTQR